MLIRVVALLSIIYTSSIACESMKKIKLSKWFYKEMKKAEIVLDRPHQTGVDSVDIKLRFEYDQQKTLSSCACGQPLIIEFEGVTYSSNECPGQYTVFYFSKNGRSYKMRLTGLMRAELVNKTMINF